MSVVIPSRNGLELLRICIPALLRGGLPLETEIVVVDDCSSDSTVEQGSGEFPEVRFITRTGEPGFCHAVNLGMLEAEGEALLLMNNDVIPEKGALEALLMGLASSPGYFCAAVPAVLRPDGTDEGSPVFRFRRGLAITSLDGPGVPYPSGACSLWRRQ